MNRVSGPDANSCAGCHNSPYSIPGGRGDFASVVVQFAQRFDFVTFDRVDTQPVRGSLDEGGHPATLQTVGNARVPPGLFGAGYLEMLARQVTADLQRTRDSLLPGQSTPLLSTGICFGRLSRFSDGRWNTRAVEGLPPQSLASKSAAEKPTLVVRPWLASATSISLREITNTSLNQHFGMQSTERFGTGTDPDGDGIRNELTRGDLTALTMFVATLPVPGRVTPIDPALAQAVVIGEQTFARIGCAPPVVAPRPRRVDVLRARPLQPARERPTTTRHTSVDRRPSRSTPAPAAPATVVQRGGHLSRAGLHRFQTARHHRSRPEGRRRTTRHQPARHLAEVPRGQPALPDVASLGRGQHAAVLSSWAVHDVARSGDGSCR